MTATPRTCALAGCGVDISGKQATARFCSEAHYARARRGWTPPVPKMCELDGCGVVFVPSGVRHRFCSKECAYQDPRNRAARILRGAIRRCHNPDDPAYEDYGGRGIYVHDRYLGAEDGLENLIEDIGLPAPDQSLDRFPDCNGGYCPGNLRWATDKEQCNNRNSSRWITWADRTLSLAQWAEETGIAETTISRRLDHHGWSIEAALTAPPGTSQQHLITTFGRTRRLTEWASETGLDKATIRGRLSRGWSPEQALSAPARGLRPQYPVTAFGRTQWLAAWAKETGIAAGTIHKRLKSGWPPEQALSAPASSTRPQRLITAFGKTQRLAEWAKETGIAAETITKRLSRGWSPERAVSTPVPGSLKTAA